MSTPETTVVPVPHIVGAPAPAPAVPRFLEALPEGLLEGIPVPLGYHLASHVAYDPRATGRRAAGSAQDSSQVACVPFYKPISRCMGGR